MSVNSNNSQDIDSKSVNNLSSSLHHINKEVKTKKKKRRKTSTTRHIFDHSTPSIFTSALSMGVGLGGGLAPNSHLNIHKYHRYNKSDELNITIKKFQQIQQYQQYKRNHHTTTNHNQQSIGQRKRISSFDGSTDNKQENDNPNKLKRGSDIGGATSFDENMPSTNTNNPYLANMNTIRINSNNPNNTDDTDHETNSNVTVTSYTSFHQKPSRRRASSSESIKSTTSNPSIYNHKTQASPIRIRQRQINYSKDDNYTSHYEYSMAGMSHKRRYTTTAKRKGSMSRGSRNNSPRMTNTLFDLTNVNDFVATNEAKSVVTTSFAATHDGNFKVFEDHF